MSWKLALQQLPKGFSIGKAHRKYNSKCYSYEFSKSESDIRRAYEAVKGAVSPRLHVFLATSDIHMKYKLCMSKEDVLDSIYRSVTLGKSLFPTVQFSAEDATRTSRDF